MRRTTSMGGGFSGKRQKLSAFSVPVNNAQVLEYLLDLLRMEIIQQQTDRHKNSDRRNSNTSLFNLNQEKRSPKAALHSLRRLRRSDISSTAFPLAHQFALVGCIDFSHQVLQRTGFEQIFVAPQFHDLHGHIHRSMPC